MIVEGIIICLLARLKKLRLRYLWRTWTFYPVLAVQVMLVVFQASVFFRQYVFVPFVPYLEMSVIFSFFFAMVAYKLYSPAILGSASIVAGTFLNKLVIAQNGGHMPVMPTLSYLTGYLTPAMLSTVDSLHTLAGPNAKLLFLADYIDYGYSILSPGDVLIHLYACVMFYALIRAVNKQFGNPNPTSVREENQ
ncbi:MAG TPA: DUF5317 family protein [Candidatus Limiplasma sp.]|nr:DUF5317 family protein [Candidatus Limiplasma sp.]HPS80624.1 DUF5317 family protein [Candidatus Limiplasma sp.]